MTVILAPSSRALGGHAATLAVVGLTLIAAAAMALDMKSVMIAAGAPVAAAAAFFLVRRPAAMLAVMVVLEVTNAAVVFEHTSPLPIASASLALGMLTTGFALRDPVHRGRLNRMTAVFAGLMSCYLVTQLLAALGSQNSDLSYVALEEATVNCLFLLVVLMLIQITGKPWTVAAAVVAPLAVICVLCAVSLVVSGGAMSFGGFTNVTEASGQLATTPRFAGPLTDSNFWGRHLVLALPLAGALIVRAVGLGRRRTAILWSGAALALLAGVYLTQSRGTLIATAIACLVWVLASGPVARRWGLRSLPAVALIVLVPGIGDRILALATDVSQPKHAIDPSIVGRINAQEIAWAMFRDRPIFGSGPALFEPSVPRYAGVVDTAVLHPTDAPHNLYAQLAAESGVVGLIGWVVFVGGIIYCLLKRAGRGMCSDSTESIRTLVAAVLAGLVAWSFASVFLHLANLRTLGVVLALAAALCSAGGQPADAGARKGRASARPEMLRIVLGVAAGAAVLVLSTNTTHTVSQKFTLQPMAQLGWDAAYALDIKTRETFLPTYAAMMAADTHGVATMADPVRGVITVSVDNTDMSSARADLASAMGAARKKLSDLGADNWYTVTPVGDPTIHVGTSRTATTTFIAVLVGTLVTAALVHTSRRRRLRHNSVGGAGGSRRSRQGVRV